MKPHAALAALLVAASGFVAACGDDGATPGSAGSCEQLVRLAGTTASSIVEQYRGKAAEDLDPGTAEDPYPELTRPFAPFEARAEELGCDRGELRRLACQSYRDLEPTGPAMEEFLARVEERCP